MIYVVLPVHNRLAMTQRCVRCLLAQTHRPFHLVLVDDGCDDGTPQQVAAEMAGHPLTILRGERNLWWAGALQLAYRWLRTRPVMPHDAVLLLNDDVTFGPEFLAAGLACLDGERRRWVQAVAHGSGGVPPERGVRVDLLRLRFRPADDTSEANCLSTRGLMLDLAAFVRSGGFRPRLLPHYLSDYEFTLRGARHGALLTSCEAFSLRMDTDATGLREAPQDGFFDFVRSSFSTKATFNPLRLSIFVVLCCPAWVAPFHLARIWAGFARMGLLAGAREPLGRLKYWLRRTFWGGLRHFLPAELTDRVGGMSLRYRVRGDIGRSLYMQGSFEKDELAILEKIMRARPPGDLTIFDVGANVGVHSVVLCKSLPRARVVAFEPAADTRRILEENVQRNGLAGRVVVEPYALSNALGTAEFYDMEDDAYSSLKDTGRKQLLRKTMVRLETLDHYVEVKRIRRIDLVKIDVEGFETQVIEGGLAMLRAMQPDLFVEIYQGRNSNPDPARTIDLLLGAGYRAWIVVDGRLQPYSRHEDNYYNYYFSVRDVAPDLDGVDKQDAARAFERMELRP
jgi:FkbM family methyltransferase